MSLMPWKGCPMCGAPSRWMCKCPTCEVSPRSPVTGIPVTGQKQAVTAPQSVIVTVKEFDPVAFMRQRTVQHLIDQIPYDINEDFIALATEAAKQQARKDAEICKEMAKKEFGPRMCAQAIEREAGL